DSPAAAPAAHAGHGAATPGATLSADDAAALARLSFAIATLRDSTQKQLSLVRNKTAEHQTRLREEGAHHVAALLKTAGMTEAEYRRRTWIVSTDPAARRAFDETMAKLTGTAAPGQMAATGAPGAAAGTTAPADGGAAMAATLPAGPLGAHLGHVLQSFKGTPMERGLLPTALAEARVAAQHAALAAKDPENLAAMQQHAAHVLHAVDPSAVASGPGLGYGVKKAAEAVAAHIEMAGQAQGAAPAVGTHAGHVATAARSAAARAAEVAALAQRIGEAKSAADAAGMVSQLVSLTNELTAGRDANADGKIEWKDGEGGLQQAEEHAKLMLNAAR
ncbi:hypothetical protein PYV61_24890, partial [Roseisolibacter sp. H3M3-2]